MPMADVCYRYLHARRNWSPGSGQLLLKDDLHSTYSMQPEQCQQGCLTAERDVCRAWHPQSPLLWQWPTICECPVSQLLYILGHNTWNLKSALPTIQWTCQGMHQVHKTYTPMSQVQCCQSTACLASTLRYTHLHQASISSRATVPVLTQNNHSSQDPQQQPVIHTSPWADWHMLWSYQITGQQMQQNTCATICWSTSCNVWHSPKDLGSCYCDMCPTMEQLSSMHQQWFHIPLHVETPLWMQCQSSQHCPKWHNCHTTGFNKTLLLNGTTCTTTTFTVHAAHTHCTCNTGIPDEPGPSYSHHTSCSKECPSTNATMSSMPHTSAAMKIWPCLHGTQMPDPGNLGTFDPDCPWTLFL